MMKTSKLITLSLLSLAGLSLTAGAVLSGWAVTDNAGALVMNVGLSEVFTIRFMNADGTSVYYSEGVNRDAKLSSVPSDPTLEGYTFDGWTTDTTTYLETGDNLATKTYSSDVTYYPRFASYGYSKNGGSAVHLPNKWDINNNITFAGTDVISLGTYIKGKASLEDVAASNVTIVNNGDYAVVCDAHEASWDSSKAATFNNWHVQKYYTITKTDKWIGKNVFATVTKSDASTVDLLTQQAAGQTYYFYADYNATSVTFKAIYSDSDTQDHILNDDANIEYKYGPYTFDNTSNYNLSAIEYYLCGSFNDWTRENEYKLTVDSEDSNIYRLTNVALEAGDKIKVNNNAGKWFTNATEFGSLFYLETNTNNIVLNSGGVYNITFYEHSNEHNHVVLEAVTLKTTFRYVYEVPSGKAIFVPGTYQAIAWTVNNSVKMSAVAGQANTYELVSMVAPGDYEFKFVLADTNGSDAQWDLLNKSNREISAGGTASDTYLINYTVSTTQSWAFTNAPVFVYYEGASGTASGWKQVSFTSGDMSVTISIPKTATKFLLVRCANGTTTPDWSIKSGDGAGRIYNQTADTACNTGTASYSVSFVDYPPNS